mgnify:CR=1 FL=1
MFDGIIAYLDSIKARDPAPRSRWEILTYPGVWALAMFRYMKARSEIVDVDSLLQIKRDIDRADQRKRR